MLATCGWSATTRHTGDKHDKGTLRDQGNAMTWEHFQGYLANMTHPKRVMTLAEMANMAVFNTSDKASGMTGTTVNLTMGGVAD